MNLNSKCRDADHLLQLANELETSIISNNETLDKKWYSLAQLHGDIQAFVEILRPRKLYISELI